MPSKANATIIGHTGQPAEFKYTAGGTAILTLSVATNKWQPGDAPDITTWWNVVMFGARAESLHQNIDIPKGCAVAVFGEPFLEKWAGQDGDERQTLKIVASEIIALGSRSKSDVTPGELSDQGGGQSAGKPEGADIPF